VVGRKEGLLRGCSIRWSKEKIKPNLKVIPSQLFPTKVNKAKETRLSKHPIDGPFPSRDFPTPASRREAICETAKIKMSKNLQA